MVGVGWKNVSETLREQRGEDGGTPGPVASGYGGNEASDRRVSGRVSAPRHERTRDRRAGDGRSRTRLPSGADGQGDGAALGETRGGLNRELVLADGAVALDGDLSAEGGSGRGEVVRTCGGSVIARARSETRRRRSSRATNAARDRRRLFVPRVTREKKKCRESFFRESHPETRKRAARSGARGARAPFRRRQHQPGPSLKSAGVGGGGGGGGGGGRTERSCARVEVAVNPEGKPSFRPGNADCTSSAVLKFRRRLARDYPPTRFGHSPPPVAFRARCV